MIRRWLMPVFLLLSMLTLNCSGTGTPELADLQLTLTGPAQTEAGLMISVLVEVSNAGEQASGDYQLELVLSQDQDVSLTQTSNTAALQEDTLLGQLSGTGLAAGEHHSHNLDATIPTDTPVDDYFLCAVIDRSQTITESNEANNVACQPLTVTDTVSENLIQPANFSYLGAFRLPDAGERPETFAYGGNAMTFRPASDPAVAQQGPVGSLLITGHPRLPYGELPDGSQVAEVSIPQPLISQDVTALPQAEFLQSFHNVTTGQFSAFEEIPRIGMAYLDHPATGPKLHLAFGQHFEPEVPAATHAWVELNLAEPRFQGSWFIGQQSFYSVNDYLFAIPESWAARNTDGRVLATGRYRDGGWSGMGPALFAYRPWLDAAGTPAADGTRLAETPLLLYENSNNTEDIERSLDAYQHVDSWDGAVWLSADSASAVLFAGTKGTGAKYWYGFLHPEGTEPCVAEAFVGQFPVCRLADGALCPAEDLVECADHNDFRGWWSSRTDAQFILYKPADLAKVSQGQLETWEPQPYAVINVNNVLFDNPAGVETEMLGTGVQRIQRLGAAAFDDARGLLYVLEPFADEVKPVVHVWHVQP